MGEGGPSFSRPQQQVETQSASKPTSAATCQLIVPACSTKDLKGLERERRKSKAALQRPPRATSTTECLSRISGHLPPPASISTPPRLSVLSHSTGSPSLPPHDHHTQCPREIDKGGGQRKRRHLPSCFGPAQLWPAKRYRLVSDSPAIALAATR